jgi:tryptophanyl-tRNA synthetase
MQPSGEPHLGNYVGAIARWAQDQSPDHVYCVVDLHAITVPQDPGALRTQTLELAAWLYAAGLDPDVVTLFVQSAVHEHAELGWILQCVATMGELNRMTQFKDKSAGRDSVLVGLYTYPVLQAADILLYQTEEVPVGEDQRQHIELTRDVAQRFNARFGETFVLPRATLPPVGARIMDLQQPDRKMSKSTSTPAGVLLLGDDEATTRRKIMRAVTDSGSQVRPGPDKPAVTNLLDVFAAVTGRSPQDIAGDYDGRGYGDLKRDLAEAINAHLRPVRTRYAEIAADPGALREQLRKGAGRAQSVAAETLDRARRNVGLAG